MYTIFHSNCFENLIFGTCTAGRMCGLQPYLQSFAPRVENRSFVPLCRYRKSDFQKRRYEKIIIYILLQQVELLEIMDQEV